jgi:rhamnogalacturonyl hydrolase YesR/pectin methylesterase-like acyl-CoA thioesterase
MKSCHSDVWIVLLAGLALNALSYAEELPWSQRAANAAIARWPDGRFVPAGQAWTWNYSLGTLLEGMDAVWLNTADPRYYNYIKSSVDQFVGPDGSIPTLKVEEYQLDNILLARQLLLLYGVTQDSRYEKAATLLYQQLMHQPRTPSGGFWHKQRYPNQMWLDGLYMAEPFYAKYASTFHHPEAFSDITRQFVLMDEHARDSKSGLLYHGWDESRRERWASKQTGLSSQFWARGMGWYMMALVDTLSYYPADDPGRKQLIALLNRDAAALANYQDGASGLWYQVLDKAQAKGNYLESSASCMFVYALAKGVRQGYLAPRYLTNAEHGYQGILSHFVQTGPGDEVSLTWTVKGAGLGGDPYRDGSYAYYIGEAVGTNDPKGVGAFLLASTELEIVSTARPGCGKALPTVTVSHTGEADFSTVQAALDHSPQAGEIVRIAPGTYREKLSVTKPNIHLVGTGAGPKEVVLSFGDSVKSAGSGDQSASVSVEADGFEAENLTIENTWETEHPAMEDRSQAVALLMSSDRAVLDRIRIRSGQDTLFANSRTCHGESGEPGEQLIAANVLCQASRQFFNDCYIEGHVDYIFGDAKAVFDHCELHSRANWSVMITAQGRDYPAEESGYYFLHCRITGGDDGDNVVLGRPWRAYSTVTFYDTDIEQMLAPEGWSDWGGRLKTSIYREYGSHGSGVNDGHRVVDTPKLSAAEEAELTPRALLEANDDWDPQAEVVALRALVTTTR